MNFHREYEVFQSFQNESILSGDNSKEDTPVPIPNTEVKLFSADDTWWVTAWESKTSPDNFLLYRETISCIIKNNDIVLLKS